MYWPETIGMTVDAIDSAPFLTPSEKRDIFYKNGVRFYRIAPAFDAIAGECGADVIAT